MNARNSIIVTLVVVVVIAVAAPLKKTEPEAPPATASKPVLQYDQRYILRNIGRDTRMIFDTATGKIWCARRAKIGLDRWKTYDLETVGKEKGGFKTEITSPLDTSVIHGRYIIASTEDGGSVIIFLDTLTGRTWSCRQGDGILDIWKIYDLDEISEKK